MGMDKKAMGENPERGGGEQSVRKKKRAASERGGGGPGGNELVGGGGAWVYGRRGSTVFENYFLGLFLCTEVV